MGYSFFFLFFGTIYPIKSRLFFARTALVSGEINQHVDVDLRYPAYNENLRHVLGIVIVTPPTYENVNLPAICSKYSATKPCAMLDVQN